jgi:hypothetical protein
MCGPTHLLLLLLQARERVCNGLWREVALVPRARRILHKRRAHGTA